MSVSHEEADLLVIGSGPAGVSAAAAFGEHGGSAVVVSEDVDRPYQRPPLSKDHLRGESVDDDLWMDRPESVTFRHGQRVVGLDPRGRTALLDGGGTVGFAGCVLATGSEPLTLPVPGGELPGLLRLRSLADERLLRSTAARAGSAVVVGSGFIGCEAAGSLRALGLDVTVVSAEALPQQDRLGPEAAERIAGWLRDQGVALRGGVSVEALEARGEGFTLRLGGHGELAADLVLVAAGVRPRVALAAAPDLTVRTGRVVVDERMRTSSTHVFAAGDITWAYNPTAGRRLSVEHWGEGLAMGQVAGICAAGGDAAWGEVPGFWSEIGGRTLKYAAWGDGFDSAALTDHCDGAFTVWYGRAGVTVGVLTQDADDDYERGSQLVASAAPVPPADYPQREVRRRCPPARHRPPQSGRRCTTARTPRTRPRA
ncbi:FAD-dependent oxidoreductase [soil metagenome]